jgi:DNA-binding beta-propeller fold protein YncE
VHSVAADVADPFGTREGGDGRRIPNFPLDRDFGIPGSGRTLPPSITVYAKNASGDTPPLRVIQGPRTQLNWPTGVAVDPGRGELYVTNDTLHSILVFDVNASGDVAPKRVLRGPRTGLKNPTGIALDFTHGEFWVANFGGHTATAYALGASGDTPPLRTIRAAPNGTPSLMIGNPGAVAFDTKREEILAPN